MEPRNATLPPQLPFSPKEKAFWVVRCFMWYHLAGGISVVPAHHVTHTAHRGRGRRAVRGVMWYARLFRPHPALACHLPHPGEGFFGCADAFESAFKLRHSKEVSAVRPPSSGAGAPPSPSKGKAAFGCTNLFCSASQSYRDLTFKSALSLTVTNRRSSLPL